MSNMNDFVIKDGVLVNYLGFDTEIEIPDTVTKIGDYVFQSSFSLVSVKMGNVVTTIGESAFYGCTSLTSIDIPDSVVTVDGDAFYDCNSLKEVGISDASVGVIETALGAKLVRDGDKWRIEGWISTDQKSPSTFAGFSF